MTVSSRGASGPIAWMVRNSVAANLLMFVIVLAGAMGLKSSKQEVFPSLETDIVSVSVPYPGASPEEVEQGLVLAIEEAVRGLDGVKRVSSTAAEGAGAVQIEVLLGTDPEKVLADVKSSVDRIMTFPLEAERPKVSLIKAPSEVISVVLSGDQELSTLHALAERVRADLIALPEVTQVALKGVPPLEMVVEIPRETQQSLDLTVDQVARQIAAASLELPGGSVETEGGEVLVRVADRRVTADDFRGLILKSTPDGALVRLGDVATIRDGYADDDFAAYFDNQRAVQVVAYRVGDETPPSVAGAVKDYVSELEASLPDPIAVTTWNDQSKLLAERFDLLVRNAQLGLVLVLVILALFLELRLAFWVALGIPISFMGCFLLMPIFGVSVNMISLFGLIITLGMVVDDAIVVGEAAYERMEAGLEPLEAAIQGAQRMVVPVTFAILTTVAAFSPMFFVPGFSGKLFRILPAVIVAVLIFSLIESFFVLPAHLAHLRRGPPRGIGGRVVAAISALVEPVRKKVTWLLREFIERVYAPVLSWVLDWRGVTISLALALLFLCIGLVGGKILPFSFMPSFEGNLVTASARLPYGVSVERTREVKGVLERSLERVIADMGPETVQGRFTTVGQGALSRGPVQGAVESGSHLLTIQVNLVGTESRSYSALDFAEAWTAATPTIAGLESLAFESSAAPGVGAAVSLELSHSDTDVLARASSELADVLRAYEELTDIENSWLTGKTRFDFHLRNEAHTLGLTGQDLARQLRADFFGAEALREQRGRNELKVMVRLPADQRSSEYDLESLRIRSPTGAYVPLSAVAEVERSRAPTEIIRVDGQRTVTVSAELAAGVSSSQGVLSALRESDLPALRAKYPGLALEFAGQQRSQGETFASLGRNYIVAMFVIYALLAVPFRSYIQPIVIMAAIPFGIVGAFFGHLVMQFELSVISMFGIVALSGVVVNDSLVLVDTANRYRSEGKDPSTAIMLAGKRRLRPILLTSLTTFFGLVPMIAETSVQARFIVPMAISLGYGVLFATGVILILIPVLYVQIEELRAWWAGATPSRSSLGKDSTLSS